MKTAITVENVRKEFTVNRRFGDLFRIRKVPTVALNGVSFEVKEGEIFGLLGPNGAGKTTLIKILTTLIYPSSGAARVYNHDVVRNAQEVRSLIGLIHSDERSFFWRLTGRQNLEFFAAIFDLPGNVARKRIDELFHLVGLEEEADTVFHYYSTGMKQKLAIARGLLTHPKILFMDEALRSIDPVSSHNMKRFIKKEALQMLRGAIVMATHRLDEAAELCDRIAILDKGNLIICGSKDELAKASRATIQYALSLAHVGDDIIDRIRSVAGVLNCVRTEHDNHRVKMLVDFDTGGEGLHVVLSEILKSEGYIHECVRIEPSFDSVFQDVIAKARGHIGGNGQS